jgi:hypothetical protein
VKVRVSFVADVTINGGKIRKDELCMIFVEWLYDSDALFSDSIADYVPEELEFDDISLSIDEVSIK